MFSSESEFRELVERFEIELRPNPSHRQKLREQALSVFKATQKQKAVTSVLRTIAGNLRCGWPVKLATAAVVIIAVALFLHSLASPIRVLGEIIENTKKMDWLHMTIEGSQQGMPVSGEIWMSPQEKIMAGRDRRNGILTFADSRDNNLYIYNPGSNEITVIHPEGPVASWQGVTSPLTYVETALQQHKKEGHKIKTSKCTYKGKEVLCYAISAGQIIPGQNWDIKLYVDTQSNLLTAQHLKITSDNHKVITDTKFEVDYPQSGPRSIYDLGAPATAKVVRKGAEPSADAASELKKAAWLHYCRSPAFIKPG